MRRGGLVVVFIVAVGLAGCSSGGSGLIGGQQPQSAIAGHGSPKAAVVGFLTDLKGGSTAWCSYVDPSDQSECQTGAQEVQIKLNGNFTIGNDVVQGNEALVAVTGSLCLSDSGDVTTPTTECQSNEDPNAGLPPKAGTFSQAYSVATGSNDDTTVPCLDVSGDWYVNAQGFNSGTTSTTTPTTVPPTTPTSFGSATTVPNTVATTVPTTTPTTRP